MNRLRHFWHYLWTSLWFVPALLVLAAVLLAIGLVYIDVRLDAEIRAAWPQSSDAGAAGSRGMLEVIATSMITVAGVVFSITLAALAQASNQYSSRLLRNFMSDRTNQTVLGVFVSIFIYCLIVLRTIRGGDEGAFVPSLAVWAGIGLAFIGIGFLIYFIHHTATSIQASEILARVASETIRAVDHLFPELLGEGKSLEEEETQTITEALASGEPVLAQHTGYIQSVDNKALLAFAREQQVVLRMELGIGDFAIAGAPLATLVGRHAPGVLVDEAAAAQLNSAYTLDRQRTVQQDAAFGIRQIADVANRALSAGINDTTTAVMCVDYLTALLVRLTQRHIPSPLRYEGPELRVIARGPTFENLLAGALDEVRRNSEGDVTVLAKLVEALRTLEVCTEERGRRQALLRQADALAEVVQRSVNAPPERAALAAGCARLISALQRARQVDSQ